MNCRNIDRRPLLLTLLLLVLLGPSSAAASEFDEFGFESVNAEASSNSAGSHPDLVFKVAFNHHEGPDGKPRASARLEELVTSLPPGLVGNPNVALRCGTGEFLAFGDCPVGAQVGLVRVLTSTDGEAIEPLFNVETPHENQAVARLGFLAVYFPTFIDISVRTEGDYGVTATVHDSTGLGSILSAETVLWGVPAEPKHDKQRLTSYEALFCPGTACKAPGGKRSSGLVPRPFISNPTACEEREVRFAARSYELPNQLFTAETSRPETVECQSLAFPASLEATPTSRQAGAPTGVKVALKIPQNEEVNGRAASAIREATATLPQGMTISSSTADGLEACSSEQVAYGEEVPSACPNGAKLGTATFVSPALPEPIQGAVYQRTPEPGHLFRLWLVTNALGLDIKIPGEVTADQQTGQLTAEFKDLPQLPVEEVVLNFKSGPRAPLKNPDKCGTYPLDYELVPWSGGAPVLSHSDITVSEGCEAGFSPTLSAGTTDPRAGAYSPLVVRLSRNDAEGNVADFGVKLPRGLLANLSTVELCPEADASTGDCPSSSRIGSISVATGAGPLPLWLPQSGNAPIAVYLAGPYKDAPYSIVTRVPAKAGPFDLGTVLVRSAIFVDSRTARVNVQADPLPQMLEGVPILYRTIKAVIDRPQFSLNPTNCTELKSVAWVNSADGQRAEPSSRFQVGHCADLSFRPHLGLKLKGSVSRGGFPTLTATLKAKGHEANIGKVSVALPHSEFLAQNHLENICTRVQFAAGNCPLNSVYGHAVAHTSLLSRPLEGNVYLRSSNHLLPDLVVALRGQLAINLVGRIDSVDGGIRTTFSRLPDAPITSFTLQMQGGGKGLLENSTNLCRSHSRAEIVLGGQNGRGKKYKAPLNPVCR